jgi:o-succinylbenzoate synthase
MTQLAELLIHRVAVPLTEPYKVAIHVYHEFDALVVEARDNDGRVGWGEAVIRFGYGSETADGGTAFCTAIAPSLVGRSTEVAKQTLAPTIAANPQAATALIAALEMLEGSELLAVAQPTRVPLLAPVQVMDPDRVAADVERLIGLGFRTLKVKVGFEAAKDLARVGRIQRAAAGQATLRLDANMGFAREAACRFAAALDPAGIELFEQPCHKDDWDANAAVAAVSTVPIMLDESIYGIAEIDRAATIKGVGYVKLKLKKLGGLARLKAALDHIHAVGLKSVLGDGVATDISCWQEAHIARTTIRNAGEMNGFLKLKTRLAREPLRFADGAVVLEPGGAPALDQAALERLGAQTVRVTRGAAVAAQ